MNDLLMPEIVGTPPLTTKLINPYVERVLSVAEYDLAAMAASCGLSGWWMRRLD